MGLLEGVRGTDREGGFTRGEYGAGTGRAGLPEGVRGRDREGGFT